MDAATLAGQRSAFPIPATHVRILIVCAVRLLGDGLAEVLEGEAGVSVVARARSGAEALAYLDGAPPPDIVLIDAALPPQGPAVLRRFRQIDPQLRCVPFGVNDGPAGAAPWAETGAAELVSRSASLGELVLVLRGTMRSDGLGETIAQVEALPRGAGAVSRALVSEPPRIALTRRERQILEQIYAGRSNKEIARALRIEPSTVKCHVHNLLAKLNLQRRAQAAVWMREHEANI